MRETSIPRIALALALRNSPALLHIFTEAPPEKGYRSPEGERDGDDDRDAGPDPEAPG